MPGGKSHGGQTAEVGGGSNWVPLILMPVCFSQEHCRPPDWDGPDAGLSRF